MSTRTIVIVVAIVAGLFALGVLSPKKLQQMKCRVTQRDAKTNLEEARKRIGANLAKGDPARSFGDLAWYPKTEKYEFDINIGFNSHFTVDARATNLNGDRWHIDEGGALVNDVDGCANPP